MSKRMMKIISLLHLFLFLIFLIKSQPIEAKREIYAQYTDFSEAEQTYRNNCMSCHGANLEGGLGPNLQHVGSRLTKQAIIHTIVFGSGQMPPFGSQLSPETIQLLGEWLANKK